MWMGMCYLLFYEHVSVAVWFVCERVACLDSLGERQSSKMWMVVIYLVFVVYDRSLFRNRRGLLTGQL